MALVELATQVVAESSVGQQEIPALKGMGLCRQHESRKQIVPGINVQRRQRRVASATWLASRTCQGRSLVVSRGSRAAKIDQLVGRARP